MFCAFFVSSCVAFLVVPRTEFVWYHPKVFTAACLDLLKLVDADGTTHQFFPMLVIDWILPVNIPVGGS